jgi:RHS repeat-associated protein
MGFATSIVSLLALQLVSPPWSSAVVPFCGGSPGFVCPDQVDPPPCEECDGPPGDDDGGCSDCDDNGLPRWHVSSPNINLRLEDTTIHYQPSRGGPISFHISYRQRGQVAEDAAIFGVGTNWTCSFRSFLTPLTNNASVLLLHEGGAGWVYYTNGVAQRRDGSLLTSTNGGYVINYRSGARDFFTKSFAPANGFTYYFLTSRSDPAGQTITFNYSSDPAGVQLLSVVDCDGRATMIYYEDPIYTNQITKVVDPFLRTNALTYNSLGYLETSTDPLGITSTFTYDPGNPGWIINLNTAYGNTGFRYGGVDASNTDFNTGGNVVNRFVEVTLPTGGKHLFLYRQDCSGFLPANYSAVPNTLPLANTLDNQDQQNRNSFHWNPLQHDSLSAAYQETGDPNNLTAGDYAIGRLSHWLVDPSSPDPSTSLSLRQEPSPDGTTPGQITWYDYNGKSAGLHNTIGTNDLPSLVALVLPDGTTRLHQYTRNGQDLITQDISTFTETNGTIALRTNKFIYSANQIDLLQWIGPKNEQVLSNYFAVGNVYHQPDAVYDALNQATSYSYNGNRQVTSISRPTGLTITNIYFASGPYVNWLASYADLQISASNSYSYTNGLIFTHTDARGLTVTRYYDNLQRPTEILYPDGSTLSNIYTYLDLTAIKDRMGYWSYFGFNGIRQKVAETNANGVVTLFDYCSCGSLRSVTNAWNTFAQQITTFDHDLQGNLLATHYADGYSVSNWFNPMRQLTVSGDATGYRWLFYNNQGLLTVASNGYGAELKSMFDLEDRVLWASAANQVSLTNAYDLLGRVVSRTHADGGIERFGYSARGLIAYTNQIGISNFFVYDEARRKLFETNGNSQLITYTYNQAGDLQTLKDGKGQVTTWHTDEYGRITNKLDQAGVEVLRFRYDLDSRLTNRWSKEKGNTVYTYDPVGNLTFINYPSTHDVTFAYDPLNRATNMLDGIGTTAFTYTSGDQLLTEDGPFASDTLTNNYVNRLRTGLSLQQPTGAWTNQFGFDAAKRLTSVTSPAGAFGYAYDPVRLALVAQLSLPNTAYITNTYDNFARLTGTYLKNHSGTALDSYAYVYNPISQVTNLTRTDASAVALQYDKIGQLTIADSSVNTEDRGYSYDAAWNLNRRTNNGATSTFTVDVKNQLTTEAGTKCTYDANGNLLQLGDPNTGGTIDYVYDDENRLTQVSTNYNIPSSPTTGSQVQSPGANMWHTYFFYDGLGRLRKRLEYLNDLPQSTTFYIYDGNRVIQERDGSNNNPLTSYTRGADLSGSLEGAGGIGGLLARSSGYSAGNWNTHYYYHTDGKGNVTYLVDSSQGLAASYRYDPFGNTISSSGAIAGANLYRFSSKEIHLNSKMYYFGQRFYDPNLQRFINRDPIGELGGINLYGFLGNSPFNQFDPSGLCWFKKAWNFVKAFANGVWHSLDWAANLIEGDWGMGTAALNQAYADNGYCGPQDPELWPNDPNFVPTAGDMNAVAAAASVASDLTQGYLATEMALANPASACESEVAAAVDSGIEAGAESGAGAIARDAAEAVAGDSGAASTVRAAAEDAGEATTTVYRGVAETTKDGTANPGYGPALQGNATPRGWPNGVADPVAHNNGETANSLYTSWTTDPQVALEHATYEGNGVVLQYEAPNSRLTPSPDVFNDAEVLIHGPVTGANATRVTGPR